MTLYHSNLPFLTGSEEGQVGREKHEGIERHIRNVRQVRQGVVESIRHGLSP